VPHPWRFDGVCQVYRTLLTSDTENCPACTIQAYLRVKHQWRPSAGDGDRRPTNVGRYHRLCATVSTVKKYRGTRYYRDGTFAITSTGRPVGITGKFRGGTGTVPRNSRWGVNDYIPQIFRKYYYKLTVFSLRHVTMGWICPLVCLSSE